MMDIKRRDYPNYKADVLKKSQRLTFNETSSGRVKYIAGFSTRVKVFDRGKTEQGPIDLSFIGSRVCWSTLLHCYLAYLKVFG